MKPGRNIVIVPASIVGAVILIGLFLFHWPAWLSIAAAALVLAGALFVLRRWPGSPLSGAAAVDVPMPVPPAAPRGEEITNVLLPSMREDYYFLFSGTALWEPTAVGGEDAIAGMSALAVDAVLKRARQVTQQRDPGNASLVRYELASALSEMQPDDTGRLRAMADSVRLVLPDHDQERLNKLAAVRKEESIWEHERKYEQSRRHYLSADVLKDPGSTVVWWLARNDDQVEKTVGSIGLLARLFAAANNTDLPEAFRQLAPELAAMDGAGTPLFGAGSPDAPEPGAEKSAADHLAAFVQAADIPGDDPERALLARRLANIVTAHGQQDVADEIIRRFDRPGDAGDPPEPDDER